MKEMINDVGTWGWVQTWQVPKQLDCSRPALICMEPRLKEAWAFSWESWDDKVFSGLKNYTRKFCSKNIRRL